MNKDWCMPSKHTFDMKPIRRFISSYNNIDIKSIDPFANKNKIATITNDIDPIMNTHYNMDALDFVHLFDDDSIDLVYFDPPFTPRQLSEVYRRLGKSVDMTTTQASFWSRLKDQISKIVKPGGVVLCFGYNSQGIGKGRGFRMEEILLLSHGGHHNDTICTAERKNIDLFSASEKQLSQKT